VVPASFFSLFSSSFFPSERILYLYVFVFVFLFLLIIEYGGTPPEEVDPFHDLILVDELSRCGAGGILWAVFFSFGIALPPALNVGSQYLKV